VFFPSIGRLFRKGKGKRKWKWSVLMSIRSHFLVLNALSLLYSIKLEGVLLKTGVGKLFSWRK
jgi:hypothetical protein